MMIIKMGMERLMDTTTPTTKGITTSTTMATIVMERKTMNTKDTTPTTAAMTTKAMNTSLMTGMTTNITGNQPQFILSPI